MKWEEFSSGGKRLTDIFKLVSLCISSLEETSNAIINSAEKERKSKLKPGRRWDKMMNKLATSSKGPQHELNEQRLQKQDGLTNSPVSHRS